MSLFGKILKTAAKASVKAYKTGKTIDYSIDGPECPECGCEMDFNEDLQEWQCPDCDCVMDGEGYFYDDVYDDDDDMPAGCRACGSSTYPICRGGCPLIDE